METMKEKMIRCRGKVMRCHVTGRGLQLRPSGIEITNDRIPELRQTYTCTRKGLINLFFIKEKTLTSRHIFAKTYKYQDEEKMHTD